MKKINIVMAITVCFVMVSGVVIAEKSQENSLKRAVLKVDNLSCGGCFTTINQNLNPLEGFSGFGANLLRKLVAVDFVPPLTPEAIAKSITDSGYRATIESISEISEKESFAYIQKKRDLYSGNNGLGQGSCCSTGSSVKTLSNTSQNKTSYNSDGGSCCIQ